MQLTLEVKDKLDELYCIALYEKSKKNKRDLIPMSEVFLNIKAIIRC
jgi:hypothetical protein